MLFWMESRTHQEEEWPAALQLMPTTKTMTMQDAILGAQYFD